MRTLSRYPLSLKLTLLDSADPECLQFTVSHHEAMPGQLFLDNMGKAADMLMDLMVESKKAGGKL